MNLLIDIGNTRVKWAIHLAGAVDNVKNFDYQLDTLLSGLGRSLVGITPSQVYISNVAGKRVEAVVYQWILGEFGIKAEFAVSGREKCGLISAYNQPEQLGIDRLLAMLGARALSDRPLVVADCGTATTIDSVNLANEFIGGMILPGVDLMCRSLSDNANALSLLNGDEKINAFSTDTQSAILSGTVLATTGAIEAAVKKLSSLVGSEVKCVITGGNGAVIQANLEILSEYQMDLVLNGLSEYFRLK